MKYMTENSPLGKVAIIVCLFAMRGKILLVHGFGGSTFSWEKTAPTLAGAGWYVVAADIPGFGYSEKTPGRDYRLEEMARLFWILADTLAPGDWNLIGHSMGGNLVARMAAIRPAQTRMFVEIDGALGPTSGNSRSGRQGILTWPCLRGIVSGILWLGARVKLFVRPLLASAYGRPATESELEGYMAPLQVPGTFSTLLALSGQRMVESDALVDFLAYANSEVFSGRLPGILLIWGGNDIWVSPETGKLLSRLAGTALNLIPGAGHCPMETHAGKFLEILMTGRE